MATDTFPSINFDDIDAHLSDPIEEITHEELREEPDLAFIRTSTDEAEDFIKPDRRKSGSVKYENKVSGILKAGFQATMSNPATLPDAATIALNAPAVSRALGDLAAEDPRIARTIDWITEGTDNPYLSAAFVTAPFVLQLIRNHEPVLEPKQRGIKIPFGKRKGQRWEFPIKFGIKLKGLRNMTVEPKELANTVFANPSVLEALAKQGWIVASTDDAEG